MSDPRRPAGRAPFGPSGGRDATEAGGRDGGPGAAQAGPRRADPPALVERALAQRQERRPRWGDLGEPDRRAAVVLVLRPGDATALPGHGGRAVSPSETGAGACAPGSGDGEPPRREGPGPAPLFDRPLPAGLRGVEGLFIVRAERDGDPWSGQVGLPGGHAETVDDTLAGAALRELEEETGLALPRSALLGRLDEIRPRSERLPSVAVTPFVAWHGGEATVEAGTEVADHFWMPLAALESPRYRTVLSFRRRGVYRAFPGVGHEQGVIWGLTFAIVRRFLGLLPRVGT